MTLYLKLGGRPVFAQAVRTCLRLTCTDTGQSTEAAFTEAWKADLLEFLIYLYGGAPYYEGPLAADLFAPICPDHGAFDHFIDRLVAALMGERKTVKLETRLRLVLETIRPKVFGETPVSFNRFAPGGALA